MTRIVVCVLAFVAGGYLTQAPKTATQDAKGKTDQASAEVRSLGNFSVSLRVKDLAASKAFYEKLGFKAGHGDGKHWVVMINDAARIGLFQGLVEKNGLTFNPGWDGSAKPLADFQDVRDIQKVLKAKGLTIETPADEASTGPAFFTLTDPDGNPVMVDQHVPAPKKK
jgi:catechol 2,3-dioxygenase-like lactoylglutathione lyase family enzyme